jgi:hypothetical protein
MLFAQIAIGIMAAIISKNELDIALGNKGLSVQEKLKDSSVTSVIADPTLTYADYFKTHAVSSTDDSSVKESIANFTALENEIGGKEYDETNFFEEVVPKLLIQKNLATKQNVTQVAKEIAEKTVDELTKKVNAQQQIVKEEDETPLESRLRGLFDNDPLEDAEEKLKNIKAELKNVEEVKDKLDTKLQGEALVPDADITAANALADAEALAPANALAAAAKAEAEASAKALEKKTAEEAAEKAAQRAALAAEAAATAAASKLAAEKAASAAEQAAFAAEEAAVIAERTKYSVRQLKLLKTKVLTAKRNLLVLNKRRPSKKDKDSVAATLKDGETDFEKQRGLLDAATIPIDTDVVVSELEVLKAKTEVAKLISKKSRKNAKTEEAVKKAESLLARINEWIKKARSKKIELENTLGSGPLSSSGTLETSSASTKSLAKEISIGSMSSLDETRKKGLREEIVRLHQELLNNNSTNKARYFEAFNEYAKEFGGTCVGKNDDVAPTNIEDIDMAHLTAYMKDLAVPEPTEDHSDLYG